MVKRFRLHLIFVVLGLIITGANLSIYFAIARPPSRNTLLAPTPNGGGGDDDSVAAPKHAVDLAGKMAAKKPTKASRVIRNTATGQPDASVAFGAQKEGDSADGDAPTAHHRSHHGKGPTTAAPGGQPPHHRHHKQQGEDSGATAQPHHQGKHLGRHQHATPAQPVPTAAAAGGHPFSVHDALKKKKMENNGAKQKHEDAAAGDAKGGDAASKPPSPRFKKYRGAYVAYDSDRHEFFNKTYDEALALYKTFLAEPLKDELEQSSRLFKDILERSDSGVQLPTSPEDLSTRFGVLMGSDAASSSSSSNSEAAGGGGDGRPFCDPLNADYTPEWDALCQAYLRDIRNWQSIKPMSSILSSGRTIKFKVYYKHNDIAAVLKVSQKKFALEPASEVVAFYVDRELGFNRVPPAVWTPFPIPFLQAACASMDAFYAQWFEKFSLKYASVQPLISHNCFANGVMCVNVSLQLWLFDVHNADATSLKPSQSFDKYLALPPKDPVAAAKLVIGGSPGDRARVTYAELMDMFVFDAVIGNTDRWFGHNSFVLGGCERGCPPEPVSARRKTHSSLRFAYIDQGSSFYRNGVPDMNPFAANYEHLCRFRGRTVDAILAQADLTEPLHERVKAKLPKGIFHLASKELVQAASKRLAMVARHMRACLGNYSKEDVMFF